MANARVHRTLFKGDRGLDVNGVQRGADRTLHHLKLGWLASPIDGENGKRTIIALAHDVYALGLSESTRKQVRAGKVTKRVQRIIRNPQLRGPIPRIRAAARRGELARWREAHDKQIAVPAEVKSLEDGIRFLISKHMAYEWGGGRCGPACFNGPGDCSWFGSWCWDREVGGEQVGTTYTMAAWGEPGYGKVLTVHIYDGDPANAHECISIDPKGLGRTDPSVLLWAECGGDDNPTPGNGPSWFHPTQARIDHFSIKRHPVGH